MRAVMIAAAGLFLAGCMTTPKPVVQAPEDPKLTRSDCYTVDLFDEVKIQPAGKGVSDRQGAFLGQWVAGNWNGNWCHDLIVYKVENGGTAHMLELHGPSDTFGAQATIFKRTGTITEDGVLQYAYGAETHRYRIAQNGRLIAVREGFRGKLEAALVRSDAIPVPVPRPVRLASARP